MKKELKKMKILDLFSGIGGFSLGLERTGGFETVAFCEIEKFPQKVLKKNYAGIFINQDVRELKASGTIDVITGGFPCQDLSLAGHRKGIFDGERSSLWREMFRLIGDIRPKYALIENVTGLLNGGGGHWFGHLLSDLASIGYDAEWHRISASDIGASHCRERVWIIAYPSEVRRQQSIFKTMPKKRRNVGGQLLTDCQIEGLISWVKGETEEFNGLRGKPMYCRDDDGFSNAMDRIGACGNAVVPDIVEFIGKAILDAEGIK